MRTVHLYDTKNRPSQLVNAAEQGEVVIVARGGRPAAKLVPLDSGERRRAFLGQAGPSDPTALTVDRSDLPQPRERELC